MALNFNSGLFPQRKEIQAVYNFRDIESGTGVVQFYAIKEMKSGNYYWVENQFEITETVDNITYSGQTECDAAGGDVSFSIDTQDFKLPMMINGKAYMKLAWYKNATGPASVENITLEKIAVGGASSDLTTQFTTTVASGTSFGGTVLLELGDIEDEIIAVGEKLRVTFNVSGGNMTDIYHNPKGDEDTRQTVLFIPFKIFQ